MPQRRARLRRPPASADLLRSVHQSRAHRSGGLPTIRRVFGEGALNHFSNLLRNVGGTLAQWNYLTFKYGLDGTGNVVMSAEIERSITGQQAIRRHADCIDVRSGTNVTKISDLFWRHVGKGSCHVASHRDTAHSGLGEAFRQSEIGEFGNVIRRRAANEDI